MSVLAVLLCATASVSFALPTSVSRVRGYSSSKSEAIAEEFFVAINYLTDEIAINEDLGRVGKLAITQINNLIRSLESTQQSLIDLFDMDEKHFKEKNPITNFAGFTVALYDYHVWMKGKRKHSRRGAFKMDIGEAGYFYCQLMINCLELVKQNIVAHEKDVPKFLAIINEDSLFGSVLQNFKPLRTVVIVQKLVAE